MYVDGYAKHFMLRSWSTELRKSRPTIRLVNKFRAIGRLSVVLIDGPFLCHAEMRVAATFNVRHGLGWRGRLGNAPQDEP